MPLGPLIAHVVMFITGALTVAMLYGRVRASDLASRGQMVDTGLLDPGFLVLAMLEGFNGLGLAFRSRRTLGSAGLVHADGPGLLIQEFGVYSLGIAGAYLVAASDPMRFGAVSIAGIAINLCAGAMHLLRSTGMYFGDARPMLNPAFERKAGFPHAFALLVLFVSQRHVGPVT